MRAAGGLIAVSLALPAFAQEAPDDTVAWIKERAIPFKTAEAGNGFADLQPLKNIIGDARIVSLGESTHGSREIFQMKHRLVEFLATEMGFTIFSIEANLPESYRLNDYVLGGDGDPDKLIAGMYFWTWNTREVKAMVEWMRAFNKDGKGRIEFTGFDMQAPDVAMEEVLRFLNRADADLHAAAGKAYGTVSGMAATSDFGIATATFPVDAARGRKLLYRGWIRTEEVDGHAGLWWRCDGADGEVLAFDNMQSKSVRGTQDWKQYTLELDIPDKTVNINFGVLMPGRGTAWFDGLEVLLDDKPFHRPEAFDLDFESDTLVGFYTPIRGSYRTDLDSKIAKTGKKSLRLKCVEPRTAPEDAKKTLEGCREIHRKLSAARGELAKKQPVKDVDWAIVNARLVASAVDLRGGNVTLRDAEMAANVEWILQQNPGAKIVLWAHNGHVARQAFAMGAYLHRKFGTAHVPVAFATARGEYRAIGSKGLSNHALKAPPADSCEAAFQRAGIPRFLLDLRGVEPHSWLTENRPFRMIGAMAMDQQFHRVKLHKQFDAVIYIEETTAAKPISEY